ncbi:MAG: hypothetical protein WAM21_08055 [Steroidobacteraceae bacterium]
MNEKLIATLNRRAEWCQAIFEQRDGVVEHFDIETAQKALQIAHEMERFTRGKYQAAGRRAARVIEMAIGARLNEMAAEAAA